MTIEMVIPLLTFPFHTKTTLKVLSNLISLPVATGLRFLQTPQACSFSQSDEGLGL